MKKTAVLLVLTVVSFGAYAQYAQTTSTPLTLEQCRKMALEYNKEAKISEAKVEAADALKAAAKAQYFPNIGFTGSYIRTNNELQLLSENKMLPIGVKYGDGTFGPATPSYNAATGKITSESLNNAWTKLPDGSVAPLDKNGTPFNPKSNPEKLEWKNYAYLPADQTRVEHKDIYLGTISLIQPVYLGGKVREINKIAGYSKDIAEAKRKMEDSDILYGVDEAYWRVVSLQEKVKLAKEYSNLVTHLNSDVEDMFKEGVINRNDLLKVKVKVNEVELNLTKAQNGLELAKMALCQEVGLPLETDIVLAELPKPNLASVRDTGYASYALGHRNEMVALDLASRVAQSNVNLMKSRFMPNVVFTANYLAANPNPYKGFTNDFGLDWNVGVVVNIPIFHWGERQQTLRAAKVEQRVATLKMEEAKEKITLQVKQATFKVNEASKRVAMTQKNIERAEENLKVANDGFKEGVLSATDVLEAQALWQSAISENIEARNEAMLSESNLKKVLGELR
jgi:outer membrane protein TolC